MSVLTQFVALLLGIALPHWIIRHDERRLPSIQYLRSWNEASHWSAVVAFSWLCVPLHFVKTRRSVRGLAMGLAWTLGGILLQATVLLLSQFALAQLSRVL